MGLKGSVVPEVPPMTWGWEQTELNRLSPTGRSWVLFAGVYAKVNCVPDVGLLFSNATGTPGVDI